MYNDNKGNRDKEQRFELVLEYYQTKGFPICRLRNVGRHVTKACTMSFPLLWNSFLTSDMQHVLQGVTVLD